MVATRGGIVMKGPMPTIIDVLRLTAWSNFKRRCSIARVPSIGMIGMADEPDQRM
jgi:hypothetical protein